MFKCECCNKQISAGIPSQLFPIETRKKVYPPRYGKKGSQSHVLMDAGGTGYETVREIQVCPDCYAELVRKSEKFFSHQQGRNARSPEASGESSGRSERSSTGTGRSGASVSSSEPSGSGDSSESGPASEEAGDPGKPGHQPDQGQSVHLF